MTNPTPPKQTMREKAAEEYVRANSDLSLCDTYGNPHEPSPENAFLAGAAHEAARAKALVEAAREAVKVAQSIDDANPRIKGKRYSYADLQQLFHPLGDALTRVEDILATYESPEPRDGER